MTDFNAFEKLDQLAGSARLAPEKEQEGFVKKVGEEGQRILVIDDTWAVLDDMIKSAQSLLHDDKDLLATIYFFRISDSDDANVKALKRWVSSEGPFDVVYIDGNLGSQGSGITLAHQIRELKNSEFQPVGIITADSGFFRKNVSTNDGIRIHGKFDLTGEQAIRKMIRDIPDIRSSARDLFWAKCQRNLIRSIGEGLSLEEVSYSLGQMLEDHYDVYAWYLRERRGDVLRAVAMKDEYNAGVNLQVENSLKFQMEFLDEVDDEPWTRKTLTLEDCGTRVEMAGDHTIAAKVDNALGGGVKTMLTAFRKSSSEPFQPSDGRNLHHTAVLLRLAEAPLRLNERLSALSGTVDKVLGASRTADMASDVLNFLHEHINQRIIDQGGRAKLTMRLFLRGSGALARWGRAEEQQIGYTGASAERAVSKIWVRNKSSVYVRSVLGNSSFRCDDLDASSDNFLPTVGWTRSYLTVPLEYDGAVIGAINLEADALDSYSENDEVLVKAISRVAAASILNHRSRRFMTDLADLAAKSIDLSGEVKPDSILQDGARNLYRLCGYSDLLLFEPAKDNTPWNLVHAWHGKGQCIERRNQEFVIKMSNAISQDWEKTYIYQCLTDRTAGRVRYAKGAKIGISDVGTQGFRARNRETLSRVVIFVGEDASNPRQALMLLFEHNYPLPEQFTDMLEKYAEFLSAVYSGVIEKVERFGEQLSIARLEARQGKVYSQVRHSIASQLALITNRIKIGRRSGAPIEEILSYVEQRVVAALEDFQKHRNLLKLPEPEPINVSDIWNKIAAELQPRAYAENLTIRTLDEVFVFFADAALLEFVLFNLVDNAIKHGAPNGAKEIVASVDQQAIMVCDDGRSIPIDRRSKMFNLGVTTESKGTGQGLYLAREIVQDMDGELTFLRLGKKNCFKISLPEGNVNE